MFDISPFIDDLINSENTDRRYIGFSKYDMYKTETVELLKENGLENDLELLELLLEDENKDFEDVDVYTEDVNTQQMRSFVDARNECLKALKEARTLCKKKRYEESREKVRQARKYLKETQDETDRIMRENDTVGTRFMGNIWRFMQAAGKCSIALLISPGIGLLATYATAIKEVVLGLKQIWKKTNGELTQNDYNMFQVTIRNAYNKYYKALDLFDKHINKSEDKFNDKMAKRRAKMAKESVQMSEDDAFDYAFEAEETKYADILNDEAFEIEEMGFFDGDLDKDDSDYYLEGANADARRALKYLKKNVKPYIKMAKKSYKAGRLKDAKENLKRAKEELKVANKMLKMTLKDDRISAVIIGNLLFSIVVFFKVFVSTFLTFPLGGIGGVIAVLVEQIRAIEDDLSKFIRTSAQGTFSTADLNGYVNKIEGIFKRTEATIDKMIKEIDHPTKPIKESGETSESSASVAGSMLAQGGSSGGEDAVKKMADSMDGTDMPAGGSDPETDGNDAKVKDDLKSRGIATESDLYESVMNEQMDLFDRRMDYFSESVSSLLSDIKDKLNPAKIKAKITEPNLFKATRLKSAIETDKVRITVYTKKDPAFKSSKKFKKFQRSIVLNEKKLRDVVKKFSSEEKRTFDAYCKELKKKTDELLKKELDNLKEVQQYAKNQVAKAGKTIKENAEAALDKELFTNDFLFDYAFEEAENKILEQYPSLLMPMLEYYDDSTYDEDLGIDLAIFDEAASEKIDLKDSVKYMCRTVNPLIKQVSKAIVKGDAGASTSLLKQAISELNTGHKKFNDTVGTSGISAKQLAAAVTTTSIYFETLLRQIGRMPRFNLEDRVNFVMTDINAFDRSYDKLCKAAKKKDFDIGQLKPYVGKIDSLFKKTESLLKNMISQVKGLCTVKAKNVTEAAAIDDAIADEIAKLNDKGYVTKYSSAGHNTLDKKSDTNDDGVYKGKLYTDARVQFDGKYDLPEAPKYWELKTVDGDTYLDVPDRTYNDKDGDTDEAFQKWKDKYLASLDKWIDDLPDISDGKKSSKKKSEDDDEDETKSKDEETDVEDTEDTSEEETDEEEVKESVDDFVDSFMTDLFVENLFD